MIRFLFAASMLIATLPAQAQDLLQIVRRTVDHSAEYTVTVSGQPPAEARLHRTSRNARADINTQQAPPITVVAGLEPASAVVLVPMMRMAVDVDPNDLPGWRELVSGTPGRDVTLAPEGTETILGRQAIRFRVEGRNAQGNVSGRIWITADGIVLRAEGTGSDMNGQRSTFSAVARNVQVAAQDPNLFRVPDGFQRMQLPPQIMQQIMPGLAGGGSRPAQPAWPTPPALKN
jgi:hypothetical protein